jgi:UDP-GlcNAc:undecaprenyl-phosphate/decaprenyl-phosphate GlcNAc-1-phosphate transferase
VKDYGLEFALIFGIAFFTALLITPLARQLGLRLNIVSIPGGRHQHQGQIARTGGLALFIAFTGAAIAAQFTSIESTDSNEIIRFTGLMLGGTVMFLIGFLDDKYNLSAVVLYIGQLLAASIGVFFLIIIESFNNPLTGEIVTGWPYIVTVAVSLFWIGLMTNTVNFLDGSDGLAAGVVCIAAFMIFIHAAFRLDQVSVSLLPLALVGATLGFLPYNTYPARVFMGGGAYFLGYVLSVLSIIGGAKMATILLVMGLPLFDLGWQAVSRALQGKNPLKGDRGHLHFRLIDAGVSPRWIALGYYLFCAFFGTIALTTTSRLFKLLALGVLFVMMVLVFVLVTLRERAMRREHLG